MICFNTKDRFLSKIIDKANISIKDLPKNADDIVIYGVSKDESVDVLINENFTALRSSQLEQMIRFLKSKGLVVSYGNRWDMAREYNNNSVGLGYELRKNRPDVASNVARIFWLAANKHVKETAVQVVDETEATTNELEIRPTLRRPF